MVFVPLPPLPPRLIMRLSHHILYCDIFVKYPLQEFSVLPSINLSGWSLRCRIPRALISRWNLGSPYNWLRQLDKNNHHHQHPEVLVHILAVLSLIADTWMVLWWNFLYRTRVHYNVTRLQQLCIRHRILLTLNVFAIILTCKFMQYFKWKILSVKECHRSRFPKNHLRFCLSFLFLMVWITFLTAILDRSLSLKCKCRPIFDCLQSFLKVSPYTVVKTSLELYSLFKFNLSNLSAIIPEEL